MRESRNNGVAVRASDGVAFHFFPAKAVQINLVNLSRREVFFTLWAFEGGHRFHPWLVGVIAVRANDGFGIIGRRECPVFPFELDPSRLVKGVNEFDFAPDINTSLPAFDVGFLLRRECARCGDGANNRSPGRNAAPCMR